MFNFGEENVILQISGNNCFGHDVSNANILEQDTKIVTRYNLLIITPFDPRMQEQHEIMTISMCFSFYYENNRSE